jgi:cyanophycinase
MRRMSVVLTLLFAALPISAQQSPANGWLVIHGGGDVSNEVKERFMALAGGPNANVVMIPTAMNGDPDGLNKRESQIAKNWGVTNFTVLHTRDRVRANSDGFVEPLQHATAVLIDGGRQWRLADAYLGTAVEREIKALLARGGVVFGSSAGASIQGSFLVRGAPGTSTNPDGDNTIMMSPGHEVGFSLLPDSAIDQHIDARDRANDLAQVIRKHSNLQGIGIDQSAAIIVHGDSFFVVGGQVAIHDGQKHDGAPYYYLSPGQAFNWRTRSIIKADDEDYSLILKANSATRLHPILKPDSIVTEGRGLLESKDGSNQAINFRCNDVSLYSVGGNTYPARPDGPRQIMIRARQINTDKLHEYTCTY